MAPVYHVMYAMQCSSKPMKSMQLKPSTCISFLCDTRLYKLHGGVSMPLSASICASMLFHFSFSNLNTAWKRFPSLNHLIKNSSAFSSSSVRLQFWTSLGTSHPFCIPLKNSSGNKKDTNRCTQTRKHRRPGEFWQKVGWAQKYLQLKNKSQ